MVGGHANAENEVIYRFEFPERPGALLSFLKKLNEVEHFTLSLPQSWGRLWKGF
jgi:L-threonine ammonia-lyase (EC 4.3.1.19)